MPEHERVVSVVQEWVEKAENDLKNAAHTLKMGADCPTDTVCFHAQQCVEKYLKAFLVLKGKDFPRTHDISELTALLPGGLKVVLAVEDERRLTSYATMVRYPGSSTPILLSEARSAVDTARRVRRQIRGLLPQQALRRRRQ